MRGLAAGCLVALLASSGCGNSSAPSSFGSGGALSGAGGVAGFAAGGGGGVDATLGGPCVDDGQCNDGFDCTADRCDNAVGRCRFAPMNDRCADGLYCNGIEQCVPGFGCRPGEPVACSDQSTCTVDRCVESTRACVTERRDADGDGDPVWNCGGTDCDDERPQVNGKALEICKNGIDDDCDGMTDEPDCVAPAHDTCADALVVAASGSYELSLIAAAADYVLGCAEPQPTRRDAVVALVVPEGPALDVDVTLTGVTDDLALALARSCSDPASELACGAAVRVDDGSRVARVTLHGIESGSYPLYVSGLFDENVLLKVSYSDATPAPTNETCGTAQELAPDEPVRAALTAVTRDLTSACDGALGELVYRFELAEPSDVVLSAIPLDGNGTPFLSLRSEDCANEASELDCRVSPLARLYRQALDKGVYYVAVGASGPSDVELRLSVSPPSVPPADEGCVAPPTLPLNTTVDLELNKHTNAIQSSCLPGAIDATYTLSIAERSDVLLVERLSSGDTGALNLLQAGCAPETSRLCVSAEARALCACSPFAGSVCADSAPLRARAYDVPVGEYAVVVESVNATPAQISAFTRPALPSTLVTLSDGCDDAVSIPEVGGRFTGNTANANPDFSASCDFGVGAPLGAPDQLLQMHLSERRRVILDAGGSDYATILAVRSGADCPGREVEKACAAGCSTRRSFLDLTLPAGDYYVQVDGYVGAAGRWVLDVFFAEPS